MFEGPPSPDLYEDFNFPDFSVGLSSMSEMNNVLIEDPSFYDFDISAIQQAILSGMPNDTSSITPEIFLQAMQSTSSEIESLDTVSIKNSLNTMNEGMNDQMGPFLPNFPSNEDPFLSDSFNATTPLNSDSIIASPNYEVSDPLRKTRNQIFSQPDNRTVYA